MRTFFIASAVAVLVLASFSGTATAYFELDERLLGKPIKSSLADGRIKFEFEHKHRVPFPEGVTIPAPTKSLKKVTDEQTGAMDYSKTDGESAQKLLSDIGSSHYFSLKAHSKPSEKAFVVMKAHWEVVKLEEHVDVARIICHDKGDQNMRMSLFGLSAPLLELLAKKPESVILTAHANQHTCHGQPIFRRVTAVKVFGEEALLVTDKARYEHIFDEADMHMEVKHPHLTHINSDEQLHEFNARAEDHGAYDRDLEKETVDVNFASKNRNTLGAAATPKSSELLFPRQKMQGTRHAPTPAELEQELSARVAKRQGFFKKAFKSVVKAVSNVVKAVVTTVKQTVSAIVENVAKGITAVVDAVKKLLTINVDKDINMEASFGKSYTKNLAGVELTFDFKFWAGFDFKLYIKTNSLNVFHASVYGGLEFGGGAELPPKDGVAQAQSTLYEIKGPTITFSIGPVPVWIAISVPIIAGWSTTGLERSFDVGFRVTAEARFGVEYLKDSGFRTIADREFVRKHWIKYDLDVHATASLGAQVKFALYSFVSAYAQLTIDATAGITTRNPECTLIKITADLGVTISAGLSINIEVLSFKIFAKEWGPYRVYSQSWRLLNVCKQRPAWMSPEEKCSGNTCSNKMLALPSSASVSDRAATVLSSTDSDATTPLLKVDADDSGMSWNVLVQCPAAERTSYLFDTIGFFNNDTTLFYISISRNVTATDGGFDLVYQTMLAYADEPVTLGATLNATLVEPTQQNAEELGLPWEDVKALSRRDKGSDNVSFVEVEYVIITFSKTDLAQAVIDPSGLCKPQDGAPMTAVGAAVNKTAPSAPAEGTFGGRMFASFGKQLWPSFVRMVSGVLVTVLIIAVIEMVLGYYVVKVIPAEHWPKTRQDPRIREKVYSVVAICVGILCFIIFVVGASIPFAEITGAQLIKNFTKPTNPDPSLYVVASGVNTIVWNFQGANIKYRYCPQYGSCSPDCRDYCKDTAYTWTTAQWPYCPSDAVATGNGGCTQWAFDAIINAIFAFLFLVVGVPVAMLKFDTVYRRGAAMHACLMLCGLFFSLLWRRVTSFMLEIESRFFDPANDMVYPYTLYMNKDSVGLFETAISIYWIMCGVVGVLLIYEMYCFYKMTLDGALVKWDASFENSDGSKRELEGVSPHSGYAQASMPNVQCVSSDFVAHVMADLEKLPDDTEGQIQK